MLTLFKEPNLCCINYVYIKTQIDLCKAKFNKLSSFETQSQPVLEMAQKQCTEFDRCTTIYTDGVQIIINDSTMSPCLACWGSVRRHSALSKHQTQRRQLVKGEIKRWEKRNKRTKMESLHQAWWASHLMLICGVFCLFVFLKWEQFFPSHLLRLMLVLVRPPL